MKSRCLNKNKKSYSDYGGRGIKVCDRWMKFENFLEDMGERPAGMSLDRIDNNGNYCKENCRWATNHQQANNKRSNRLVTFHGVTKSASEWADDLGINRATLYDRLYRGKFVSVDRAFRK